jgi:hypothetical protein
MARRPNAATALAGLLTVAGIAHFVAPKLFDDIVPRSLPGSQRNWTYLSGAVELAVGAAVAVPRTRRLGGLLAAGCSSGCSRPTSRWPSTGPTARSRSARSPTPASRCNCP